MKRNLKKLAPVLFASMLIQLGCAKQQTIKVEPLAPAAASAAKASSAGPAASDQADQPGLASQMPRDLVSDPAKGATTGKEGQTAELTKGMEPVYFDFDSASLNEAARARLSANFLALQATPQGALRIEGHCDERGSDDYNMALSERRAQAAAKYLLSLGIPAERLSSIGYGEEKPAVPGSNEQAWASNRRDEFIVIQ